MITNPMSWGLSTALSQASPRLLLGFPRLTARDGTREHATVATEWQLAYGIDGTAHGVGRGVRVAERHADVRPAENLAEREGVGTRLSHSRGCRVAQVVKVQISELAVRDRPAEGSLNLDALAPGHGRGEHVVAIAIQAQQQVNDGLVERDEPLAPGLALLHEQHPPLEVHVRPLQVEQLATPEPRVEGGGHDGSRLDVHRHEQDLLLCRGQHAVPLVVHGQRPDALARVRLNLPGVHRHVENLREYAEVVVHRRGLPGLGLAVVLGSELNGLGEEPLLELLHLGRGYLREGLLPEELPQGLARYLVAAVRLLVRLRVGQEHVSHELREERGLLLEAVGLAEHVGHDCRRRSLRLG